MASLLVFRYLFLRVSDFVHDFRRRVQAGRAFHDALRDVLAANAELLVLRRKQQPR